MRNRRRIAAGSRLRRKRGRTFADRSPDRLRRLQHYMDERRRKRRILRHAHACHTSVGTVRESPYQRPKRQKRRSRRGPVVRVRQPRVRQDAMAFHLVRWRGNDRGALRRAHAYPAFGHVLVQQRLGAVRMQRILPILGAAPGHRVRFSRRTYKRRSDRPPHSREDGRSPRSVLGLPNLHRQRHPVRGVVHLYGPRVA